jgi:hypothetical protein
MRASTVLTLVAVMACATAAAAQDSRSAEAARVLTGLLDARDLSAVAAKDPDSQGRFVAALYFPGTQLLVISSQYSVPVLLEQRLARGEYREAYIDLQASPPEGRFFVQDLRANGLRPTCGSGDPFDIVYESGRPYATFNGDWAGQGLTESDYKARFASADERYARMLAALAAALRAGT